MNYFAIGIGGTGAKCVESLVHLAAAGLLPQGELHTFFVDQDKSNGSLDRAQRTLQIYQDCRNRVGDFPDSDFLRTEITSPAQPNHVWAPCPEKGTTLGSFFNHSVLSSTDPKVAHLFDILYSKRERETKLDVGFLGHPSIGAAVLAEQIEMDKAEPWATFRQKLLNASEEQSRVFLFGSIFGGTGASGLPTIARLIRNAFPSVPIGGALVLPYFQFTPPSNKDPEYGLVAKSENFMLNTHAALQYYHSQRSTDTYQSIYMIGNENRVEVEFSQGAQSQRNSPHFVELLGALAALHFFAPEKCNPGYFLAARQDRKKQREGDTPTPLIQWEDLPSHLSDLNQHRLREQLGQLARLAFSFLSTYEPMIGEILDGGKAWKAPWFVNFLERASQPPDATEARAILLAARKYLESYLVWWEAIHRSASPESLELLTTDTFMPLSSTSANGNGQESLHFSLGRFPDLVLPSDRQKPELGALWHLMSKQKPLQKNQPALSTLIHSLYGHCRMN